MANIILIGMPGSGKSTVGVLLAKTLGIGFTDTDLLIQQREKRILQDIIDRDGIEYFLDCEANAVLSLDCDNTVIATGGSVIFREKAMSHLKKLGRIIYLDVEVDELKRRLSNIKTRGIAAKRGETVEEIYSERAGLYSRYADCTLSISGGTAEDAVLEICKIL